ncbi:glycosyl hydrolase [Paenibacillus chibensis]|uniref:Glycosyl hydrolase n=1 Tax=Paenibacillus chibensis TaxID=59846 RepID=A0ABU6Q2S6_9BACL|nr:glycosyl hydrolase [Paenibacillus chibensis]
MTENVYELFVHPTAAYRGKPFWSWNGKLQKDELLRQIRIIKEMGFGGFFMHSRTGLATEYLGDEWFELVNACSEEAERLGMEAWLYDEDRWPSGTAGGIVTQEPEYRLKFIKLETVPAEEFTWKDDIFAAFACDLDDRVYANCTQIQREQGASVGEGKTILAFSIVEQEQETFYNGYTYLDTLNPKAVERFLEVTHEKYKAKSGQHFGKAIKGIFTDEPHRGALLDGFGIRNENGHWHLPWTYTLFERFQSAYGYDLVAHLPELFLLPHEKAFSQVKWHYVDLVQNMFHESFAKPINEWCERNGLILTGHTLHEDSLTAQTAMVGSLMRFYEHMGYPGVDVLTEGNINYWIVKQLSSAARQLGKTWMLSELYGCTGWQMPLEGHKAVGDWQALFGINLRCHHLLWYSMAGESKRDYPASIFHQSAWWQEYRYVEAYYSRLGVILTSGKPLCDLLVINPIESLWGQIYPGWSRNLHAVSSRVQELEQRYQDNFLYLAGAQIDFDYGDEDMLSRLCRIGKDRDGGAVLHVGQAAYRAVLVTGMVTMRASSLRILQAFRDAGGKVIFAGDPPDHIDALASDEAQRFAATVKQIPFEKTELLRAVKETVRSGIRVRDTVTGASIEDIFTQVRVDGERIYVVLMNMNRKDSYANVVVSIERAGGVEEWDCATGARKRVAAISPHGTMEWMTHFAPVQEHVYVVSDADDVSLPTVKDMMETDSVDIEGPYAYRLNEPNVCVLDRVTYCLGNDETTAAMEILKADRQIRSAMQLPFRHGEMVQPWYQETYGENNLEPCRPLVLHYRFHIGCIPETPVFLAIERPECFQIMINGKPLDGQDRGEWWVDRCFVKIPLPVGNLYEGENILDLRTMFHQHVPLEAVYLLGEFGVSIEDGACTLNKLPEKLDIGSVTLQGLPFYGGAITYHIGNELARFYEPYDVKAVNDSEETAFISFSSFEAACIKVRQGKDEQLIAWQPYEKELNREKNALRELEAQLILTRRNTFGPLHQLPLLSASYGPGNWTTEGEHFTETYALLPSGLLSAPRLVIKKAVSSEHPE